MPFPIKTLVILTLLTCSVLLFIYFVLKLIIHRNNNKNQLTTVENKKYNENTKLYNKDDDLLSKNKETEKKIEEEISSNVKKVTRDAKGRLIEEKESPISKEFLEEKNSKIVGLAKPHGFWTKFIMAQKMGYIMARMNMQEQQGEGFWVNFIKAKANSQGRDQSRGR